MNDDITFCADANNCPDKDKCLRSGKPKDPEYVSYSDFYAVTNGEQNCEYILPKDSQWPVNTIN
jgi:hypothetical protein